MENKNINAYKAEILLKIKEIEILIDNQKELTPSERRSICSLGDTRSLVVEKTIKLVTDYQNRLPHPISIERLEKLYELTNVYLELMNATNDLNKKISDCFLKFGNETFLEAKYIRKRLEAALLLAPDLKPLLDELSAFFKKTQKSDSYSNN